MVSGSGHLTITTAGHPQSIPNLGKVSGFRMSVRSGNTGANMYLVGTGQESPSETPSTGYPVAKGTKEEFNFLDLSTVEFDADHNDDTFDYFYTSQAI